MNGVLLAALTLWLVARAFAGSPASGPPAAPGITAGAASGSAAPPPVPTRDVFLRPRGPHFGLTTAQSPWSPSELDALSRKAGAHPSLLQFFVKWNQDFRPDAVAMCYHQHALPLLSWEPWAGARYGESQPAFALRKISTGAYDPYITRFATAVRNQRWPVAIRFAHEMNGFWYPWSEGRSGNRPGDFVQAWRHVHDVFGRVGATNVIWVWSPNIVRPVPRVGLRQLYPGDKYVDWAGMVGYGAGERTAAEVFDPTIAVLRAFTRKPLLITETGAQPGPAKAAWTASLFPWLRQHRDVIGFTWFELSPAEGASADWRFTADPRAEKAFHDGIVQASLAPPVAYHGPGG
ncbi:MAG: glycoside hydrolase family 26 protein [Mycobacteriales bacterium]